MVGSGLAAANSVQNAADAVNSYFQSNPCTQASLAVVSAFQQEWNSPSDGSSPGSPQIAVDGQFGPCTAQAMVAAYGSAPASCFPGTCQGGQYVAPANPNPAPPAPVPPAPAATTGGMPTWLRWLLIVLVAGGVVAASVWLYRKYGKKSGASEPKRRPRRRGKRKSKK
jgi:hypothetical protein